MRKFICLLLLSMPVCAADKIEQFNEFIGGVDAVCADKLDKKFSPLDGVQNIRTDNNAQVERRLGIRLYNTTAISPYSVKKLFTYDKVSGISYLIANSSSTMGYSNGDGNFTAIVSTLSNVYIDDYCIGNGVLYRDNGHDGLGSKWDGSTYTDFTAANSTSMISGEYIEYWHNRLWKVPSNGNIVYYSAANDPMNIEGYISFPDIQGDAIRGMMVWGLGNNLLLAQKHHTYEIVEYESGKFIYNQLSNSIGCLYDSTMAELDNYPVWLSCRGVDQWTGKGFKLLSEPIDEYISALPQLDYEQQLIYLNAADDWNSGTVGTNISTTTWPGSVGIEDSGGYVTNQVSTYTYSQQSSYMFYRQAFIPDKNIYPRIIVSKGTDRWFSLLDASYNVIYSSSYSQSSNFGVYYPDVALTAEATYYIKLSTSTGQSDFSIDFASYTSYSRGIAYVSSYKDNNWEEFKFSREGGDLRYTNKLLIFQVDEYIPSSGTYTTGAQNAGTQWTAWGRFIADETTTRDANEYFAITSTSAYNLTTNTQFPITNGEQIPSTVGPYIQIVTSFSRVSGIENPLLNNIMLYYYGGSVYPQGFVFNDRYGLAVSTGTSTVNNVLLWYQRNGGWTIDTANVGSATVHRNKLYTGDSLNTGYVFEREKEGTTSDNGTNFLSQWTSPVYMAHPLYKTLYKELWIRAENTENKANINYRYDGSTSTWTQKWANLDSPQGNIVLQKIPLTNSKYYAFQFQISSTDTFKIKEFDLLYDDTWVPQ